MLNPIQSTETTLLSIVLSSFASLLDPTNETTIHRLTMTHILTLATNIPQVFRDTVSQLPENARTTLETSVRQSVLAGQQQRQQQLRQQELQRNAHEDARQPTIQLKMDFSNFT